MLNKFSWNLPAISLRDKLHENCNSATPSEGIGLEMSSL